MFAFVLFAVFGSVTAFPPRPCCLSRQYEVIIQTVGGTANSTNASAVNVIEGSSRLVYDGISNRTAIYGSFRDPNGLFHPTKTINFYQQRVSYMINMTSGVCKKSMMPEHEVMHSPCIPDDARLLASTHVGDQHKIATNTWAWEAYNATIHSINTVDGCAPVMNGYYGTGAMAFVYMNLFTNYKAGIADMGVFSLAGHACPI
ncbi:hypothetical protein ScPMuIL_004182 [Solemya velum]